MSLQWIAVMRLLFLNKPPPLRPRPPRTPPPSINGERHSARQRVQRSIPALYARYGIHPQVTVQKRPRINEPIKTQDSMTISHWEARYGGRASISCCLEISLKEGCVFFCSPKVPAPWPQAASDLDITEYQPLRKDHLIPSMHAIDLRLTWGIQEATVLIVHQTHRFCQLA